MTQLGDSLVEKCAKEKNKLSYDIDSVDMSNNMSITTLLNRCNEFRELCDDYIYDVEEIDDTAFLQIKKLQSEILIKERELEVQLSLNIGV